MTRRSRPAALLSSLSSLSSLSLLLAAAPGCGGAHGADDGHHKTEAARAPAAPPRATPGDDDAPTVRTAPIELHRVATRSGLIRLHRLGDGNVALSGGMQIARVGEGGELVREPWLPGLPTVDPEPGMGWRVFALGGRGEDLWLTVARERPDAATRHAVFRREGAEWEPQPLPVGDASGYYADYTGWPGGQVLALLLAEPDPARLDQIAATTDEAEAQALRTAVDAAVAAMQPRLDVLAPGKAPAPGPRLSAPGQVAPLRPTAITALASGELFAALASGGGGQAGVMRWGPEDQSGLIAPLPTFEARAPRQISVLSEGTVSHVLIGDGVEIDDEIVPYIARFDGTLWQLLDPPPVQGSVTSLAEAEGGIVWALVHGAGSEAVPALAEARARYDEAIALWTRAPRRGSSARAAYRTSAGQLHRRHRDPLHWDGGSRRALTHSSPWRSSISDRRCAAATRGSTRRARSARCRGGRRGSSSAPRTRPVARGTASAARGCRRAVVELGRGRGALGSEALFSAEPGASSARVLRRASLPRRTRLRTVPSASSSTAAASAAERSSK